MKVLIVGGVAGGASAAARLRRINEQAEIILFEKGEYISFANCGLPYYIGGEIEDKEDLTLQTPDSFRQRFNVDVRTMHEVVAIKREDKKILVRDYTRGVEYEESYDKLLLSPGAEPIRPPFEGSNLDRVYTLRNIPDTYRIKDFITKHHPKKAVIVGGGFIGVEMAENLVANGIEVSLVEMANQVIAPLDYDMATIVHNHMREKGVKLFLGQGLDKITQEGKELLVHVKNDTIVTDFVVLAIGVKADSLLARQTGLALNERGGIKVNAKMQTSDPNIFAVGDAIEIIDFNTKQPAMIPLAGPANKQGRIAANVINGKEDSYQGTQGSSILKVFDLTVASTGINEKTAQRLKMNYAKYVNRSANHATYYPGAKYMTIKTLYNPDNGQILGAQLVGFEGVDKRTDILALAVRHHLTAKDLSELELCYAPPYSSAKDPVNMVGFTIENIINGDMKVFHWHDVERLQKEKNIILLDTRTNEEYARGYIPGFINIPLDELRNRLNELDKSKEIYVTCQVGLRGYIACRILSQNGFQCHNLSGGYAFYREVFSL